MADRRRDLDSKFEDQQHIGIAESFTFDSYVPRSGDYYGHSRQRKIYGTGHGG